MAKAYRVELLVLDGINDEVGEDDIRYFLENVKYLYPKVMKMECKDIGEWDDDHPLNRRDENYYQKLFN